VHVLLDEQLPRRLAGDLIGHRVRTVQQEGWAGLKNGDLLQRAEDSGFDVCVTADRNLEFQQNLTRARLGVVVLADIRPLVPAALAGSAQVRPGEVIRVSG
jgi:hypothetical protein